MHRPDFILARESDFARSLVDEEIAYFRRTRGDSRHHSRARLVQWSALAPWVALHVASELGQSLTEVST